MAGSFALKLMSPSIPGPVTRLAEVFAPASVPSGPPTRTEAGADVGPFARQTKDRPK